MRRLRQKELIDKKNEGQIPVAPILSVNGRPRKLDPDQETLDKNVAVIMGMAAIAATMAETAAVLGVSGETLADFFARYPEARDRFDDAKAVGTSSIKRQLFKDMEKNPQTAMWLGGRIAMIRDPDKMAEIEQRERALDLRERDVAAREKALDMRHPEGAGVPININDLSLAQLLQLATRIKAAMDANRHAVPGPPSAPQPSSSH